MMLSVVVLHPLQLPAGRDLSGPHITESITWINILFGLLGIVWTGPVRAIETQIFETKVHQVMNRKVVDLTTLYNFHKGSRVFFSMGFAEMSCQL
jgi:hypothetical protein